MKIIPFNPSRKQKLKDEIFGVFQNLEMKFENIFHFKKKKKFGNEIYFQISSPDFGKPQKFHDFVF